MFLIPKTVASVRVSLTTQVLFTPAGPLHVLRAVLPGVAGGKGRAEGEVVWSLPGWLGQPEPSPLSGDEDGSTVRWRDQNPDGCF